MGRMLDKFDASQDPQFIEDWKASRERLFADIKEQAAANGETIEAAIENIQTQQKMLFATQEKISARNKAFGDQKTGCELWIRLLKAGKTERVIREMEQFVEWLEEHDG